MAYVMIVDDDEDFAEAVADELRDAGHEVRIQLDTGGALTSMKERPPDVVILDVMFPEDSADGFGLARQMHHYHEKLKRIPILMLTAVNAAYPLGFSSRDIDGYWLPVAEFVEKPVDFDVLRNKVTALLQKAASPANDANEEA